MKLCVNNYTLVTERTQEVRFPFRMMNEAIDYSNAHKDKRIIMEILNLNDIKMPSIEKLRALQESTNFSYDFFDFTDFITYAKNTAPFEDQWRRIMYHYPATTWAMIKICQYYRTTDLIVGEPLVFQCDQLKKLRSQGFTIRTNPHIGMNAALAETGEDGLNHFWVLPQHLNLYADYIDVFELDAAATVKEKSLIDLYTKDYKYDLSLLIPNYNCSETIYGSNITEEYVKHRMNCGQRCMSPISSCHYCMRPEYEKRLLHTYTNNS